MPSSVRGERTRFSRTRKGATRDSYTGQIIGRTIATPAGASAALREAIVEINLAIARILPFLDEDKEFIEVPVSAVVDSAAAVWDGVSGRQLKSLTGPPIINSTGSSVDNSIPTFDGTSGDLLQEPVGATLERDLLHKINGNAGTDQVIKVSASGAAAARIELESTVAPQLFFTALGTLQEWRVQMNGDDFYITGAGISPFKILAGASVNSLVIDATGQVGIGTAAPAEALEVYGATGTIAARVASGDNAGTLDMVNESATPAADTRLGRIRFKGLDDGGAEGTYARIDGHVTDDTAGSESGYIVFEMANGAGSVAEHLRIAHNGVVTTSTGLDRRVTTETTSTTLDETDDVALCDATSGAITITLPTAATISGEFFTVKKVDSSANAVTVDGNGSETIDGDLTKVITSQYDSINVVSDGSNWHIT